MRDFKISNLDAAKVDELNDEEIAGAEVVHLHAVDDDELVDELCAEDAGDQIDLDAAVAELAKLKPLEFSKRCKEEAQRLGVSSSDLDREVKRVRKAGAAQVMQAYWNVEPWLEPVSPSTLLGRIKRRLTQHVCMTDHASTASALWVMFAWVHDAAVHSPILLVNSPEAECGKSTLLGVTNYLVPRGCIIVEVSPAVLYRMIERWHPTLIVDEADVAFKNNPELRAVVNAGWTRGVGVPRCNPDTLEPEFFETFGPKEIGLKGLRVPDTTLSRSIIIDMQRKLPSDQVSSFAHIDDEDLAELRQMLARFAADFLEELRNKQPTMPSGFANRLEANWRMLLAIAELCGKNVAEGARNAAVALSRRSDEASLGVELLRDIRAIFEEGGIDRIRSEALVAKLVDMGDRPWSEMPYSHKALTLPARARQVVKAVQGGAEAGSLRRADL